MMPALVAVVLALTIGVTLTPEQQAQARALEHELVAPCCWRQQVAIHDSPAATAMRDDIRTRLVRGETAVQIRAAYVEQYGPAILVVPPASGFTLTLHVLPPVALALTGAGLVILIRRFSRAGRGRNASAVMERSEPLAPEEQRLDDELRAMD